MSLVNFQVNTGRPDSYIEQNFQTAGGTHEILQRITQYLNSINAGNELASGASAPPSVTSILLGANGAKQASGYYTFLSVVATDAFAINGVTFTCIAPGTPAANQFVVGADDAETALNAIAAINASATAKIAGYVTASSDSAHLTRVVVSADEYGLSGNMFTLTAADATITPSGALLTGGTVDAGALTLNF